MSAQLPRNRNPIVTNIPELGVVSTHQSSDGLCHNNDQQESESSSLHQLKQRSHRDTDNGGIHVFVHPDDGFSKHWEDGEDDEEEVIQLNPLYHSYSSC